MAERGDDREAERVDPAAIVQQVDVVQVLPARQPGPERRPRFLDAREDVIGQRPCRPRDGIERRPAPSVGRELDVAPREPLAAEWLRRPEQLHVRIPRRDERQVLEVGHRVDDDRAEWLGAGHCRSRARGRRAGCGAPRRRTARLPRAPPSRTTLPPTSGVAVGIFGQVEGEAADEPAIRSVQLDRRCDRGYLASAVVCHRRNARSVIASDSGSYGVVTSSTRSGNASISSRLFCTCC